jgi:MFS family permease
LSNNKLKTRSNWLFFSLFICALGTIFYCYEYYLRVAPSVLRPELKLAHNIGEAGFGFLVSLYYWAYFPLQVPAGFIMDVWGPRKVLTIACFICAVGTYFFVSNNLLIAQIGRFLVGFGSAFAYVGVLKLSNIWLPRKFFAFMAGFCSTLGMLGGISGQIVIAKFSATVGWQTTLYVSAVVGIVLGLILWIFIKEHSTKSISQNLSIKNNNLWQELIEIIKLPDLWLNGIIGCLMFAALSVFADTWAVSFLMATGVDENVAIVGSSMIYLGFGVGAPIWGILSDIVISRKVPLILASIVAAILIFIILYIPLSSFWINIYMFLFGLFVGGEVLVFAAINDLCHKEISATAVGFVNMLVTVGGLLVQPSVGLILDYLAEQYNFNELINFKCALVILPIGLICAAILSMFLKNGIKIVHD